MLYLHLLGPLAKLKQTIRRAAQGKWHPSQVFHVGMMTPSLTQLWSSGNSDKHVYFQWCTPQDSMIPNVCSASNNLDNSDTCATTTGKAKHLVSKGPPADAKEGLIPWLSISPTLATSPACETILIDKL